MSVNTKFFKILYRLTLPGGLLLVISAALVRVGVLDNQETAAVRYVPLAIFAMGLGLCAFFRRSRLFFATLALTLSATVLGWVAPYVSAGAAHVLQSSIALLMPINLLAFAFLRERGIISPVGRKRLAWIALEIIAVAILCIPKLSGVAGLMERDFVAPVFADWSRISQPALAVFLISATVLVVLLVRRYRAVESSLLWALISSFVAFRIGATNTLAGIFFATGALAIIVAVIETSYTMAYLDELTQLPSRRALNEALMKLPETFTVAMLDVDHFKRFNDTFGHESGDQALRMVASKLAHIAGGGRAYRYGGEEFAVVFPGKPSEDVFIYLDRMRKIIEQSTFVVRGKDRRGRRGMRRRGKKQTRVTVSVGVASCNGEGMAPAEVLRIADQALYKAKARGRNCTVTARSGKSIRPVETGMRVLSVS